MAARLSISANRLRRRNFSKIHRRDFALGILAQQVLELRNAIPQFLGMV
jgi:hypothetical protein